MKNIPFRKHSLTSNFALIATFVFIIASLFLLFKDLAKSRTENIEERLNEQAEAISRVLLDRFSTTFMVMESISNQILQDPHNTSHVNNVLSKYRSDHSFTRIFSWTFFSWTNPAGRIIVDSEYGIMRNGMDLSIRDYIAQTSETSGKLFLGKPVFGSTSKRWMIPGGVGLSDAHNNYLGTLTIGFEIEELARTVQKSVDVAEINFTVFDETNLPVFQFSNNSYKVFSDEERHNGRVSKFDITKENSLLKGRLSLSKKLQDYPYYIVLEYNKSVFSRVFWEIFYSRIIEILLLAFASAALFVVVYKREREKAKAFDGGRERSRD